jgi:hypothetical protein
MVRLLLIDTRVSEYEKLNELVNNETKVINFDYYNDTYDSLRKKAELISDSFDSVGLVFHSNKYIRKFRLLNSEPECNTEGIGIGWSSLISFIKRLNVSTLDILELDDATSSSRCFLSFEIIYF